MTDRVPKLRAESFECPRCGAFAHQDWEWIMLGNESGDFEVFQDEPLSPSDAYSNPARARKLQWHSSLCFSCKKYTVWRGSSIIFPPHSKDSLSPHALMSAKSSELFGEATEVLPISPRAAAALARAAMESELRLLLDDRRSNLHGLIGKLSDKISTSLWQALTVLRETGNKALHGDKDSGVVAILLDESDAELTPFLLSAVNQIVDEMVARPKLAEDLYGLLPDGVREAAERKKDEHSASTEI